MKEHEEREHNAVRRLRQILRCGENAACKTESGFFRLRRRKFGRHCGCGLWRGRSGIFAVVVRDQIHGNLLNGSYEAIATAGEGFNESGIGGGVSEGLADAIDGGVNAVLVVDEGTVRPELARDLVAGEQLSGPLEQHGEYLEGLGVELDANALLAQFARGRVCFKYTKAVAPG